MSAWADLYTGAENEGKKYTEGPSLIIEFTKSSLNHKTRYWTSLN
jgi:hypothetical protein